MIEWGPKDTVALGYFPVAGGVGKFELNRVDDAHRPLAEFLDELNAESLRGKVIVVAAVIESLLKDLLLSYFENCRDDKALSVNAVPPSAAKQAELCVALGIISEQEFDTICCVQSVRNKFAHVVKKSFADPQIKSLVEKLNFAGEYGGDRKPTADEFLANALVLVLELFDRPRELSDLLRTQPKLNVRRTITPFAS